MTNVHDFLGGGRSADVLLWKQKHISTGMLVGSTAAWFLFEMSGYTLISLTCNVLLFVVIILFLWANAASMINMAPPPIPEFVLTEEMVHDFASVLRIELNKALLVVHDVAIGKDFRVFMKIVVATWILSIVGSWFSLITLTYLVIVAAHTLPVVYDRYQDEIEKVMGMIMSKARKQYSRINDAYLSRIPRSTPSKKIT